MVKKIVSNVSWGHISNAGTSSDLKYTKKKLETHFGTEA